MNDIKEWMILCKLNENIIVYTFWLSLLSNWQIRWEQFPQLYINSMCLDMLYIITQSARLS